MYGQTGTTCCEREGPTAYIISFLVGFIKDLGFRRIIPKCDDENVEHTPLLSTSQIAPHLLLAVTLQHFCSLLSQSACALARTSLLIRRDCVESRRTARSATRLKVSMVAERGCRSVPACGMAEV